MIVNIKQKMKDSGMNIKAVLSELFELQVLKNPEKKALFFEGSTVSYSELNILTNRIAHWLIKNNIGTENIVGVAIPRSKKMQYQEL